MGSPGLQLQRCLGCSTRAAPSAGTCPAHHPLAGNLGRLLIACPLPLCPPLAFPLAQKVDAELSRALATLESEKEAAMKSLDAQVRPRGLATHPPARPHAPPNPGRAWNRSAAIRLGMPEEEACAPAADCCTCLPACHALQVEKLSADILGRVLPEGVKV